MDITQKRQVSQEQLIFVNAVQWDQRTPSELLGTGSQQAQLYPSDIDLFSSVKDVQANDAKSMYRHIKAVFDSAEAAGDMYFIEFKLQNLDGSKTKWYDTDFDEGEFVAAATEVDFLKIDYVIFIRGPNLFTELSTIYSFSPLPPVRNLVKKIGVDFVHYFQEGKVYKSLKRMYSIYKLQGKKEKLVQLSKLFNSGTGFKYSLSSNLKAIELLLEHYNDYSIQNLVKANLKNLENVIGVKIRSSKQMTKVIGLLDAQIEKETQAWLQQGNKNLLMKGRGITGRGHFTDLLLEGLADMVGLGRMQGRLRGGRLTPAQEAKIDSLIKQLKMWISELENDSGAGGADDRRHVASQLKLARKLKETLKLLKQRLTSPVIGAVIEQILSGSVDEIIELASKTTQSHFSNPDDRYAELQAIITRMERSVDAEDVASDKESAGADSDAGDGSTDGDFAGDGRPLTYKEWEAKYAALLAQKKRAIEARERKKAEKGVPPLEAPMRTSRVIKATPPKDTKAILKLYPKLIDERVNASKKFLEKVKKEVEKIKKQEATIGYTQADRKKWAKIRRDLYDEFEKVKSVGFDRPGGKGNLYYHENMLYFDTKYGPGNKIDHPTAQKDKYWNAIDLLIPIWRETEDLLDKKNNW